MLGAFDRRDAEVVAARLVLVGEVIQAAEAVVDRQLQNVGLAVLKVAAFVVVVVAFVVEVVVVVLVVVVVDVAKMGLSASKVEADKTQQTVGAGEK